MGRQSTSDSRGAKAEAPASQHAGKDRCDAVAGGWYYDLPPEAGTGKPTQIVVCDRTCSLFTTGIDVAVKIALGCSTL